MLENPLSSEAKLAAWARKSWEKGRAIKHIQLDLEIYGLPMEAIKIVDLLQRAGLPRDTVLGDEARRQFSVTAMDDLEKLHDLSLQIADLTQRAKEPGAPSNLRLALRVAREQQKLLFWKVRHSGVLPKR